MNAIKCILAPANKRKKKQFVKHNKMCDGGGKTL